MDFTINSQKIECRKQIIKSISFLLLLFLLLVVRDEPRVRRAVRPRYEKGTVGKGLVAHCRFASQPFLTIRGTVAPWLMTVPSSPSRRARSLRRVYNPFVLSSVFICWSNLGLEDRNLLLIHMFLYYISYVGPKDPVSPVGPTRLLMLE